MRQDCLIHICVSQQRVDAQYMNEQSCLLTPSAPAISTVFGVVLFSFYLFWPSQLQGQSFPSGHPTNPLIILFPHPFSCPFRLPLKWILVGCFAARQAQGQTSSHLRPHFLLHLQPQPGEQSLHPVQHHPFLLRLGRLPVAGFFWVWWGCSPWGSQDRTLEQAELWRAPQPVPEGTEVPCGIG